MKKHKLYILKILIGFVAVFITLQGCTLADNQMRYDRSGKKSAQEYKDILAARPMPTKKDNFIPKAQPYISDNATIKKEYPLVSISVNQTVSLRDLLFELADQANIDLEMDPQIRGSLIFTVRNRPLDEVVKRIADMAGLRYKFEDNVLRVELDRPYLKTYNVEFLNFTRKITSDTKLTVSVISETETKVGSGANINTKIETDFWDDIETNLEQILSSTDTYISLATLDDPVAQPRAATTSGDSVEVYDMSDLPPPVLNVTAPPSSSAPAEPNPPATFSINKQTGIISVFASEKQQKLVENYLEEIKKSVSTQVLVEAKILQVELLDEFSTGIDWQSAVGGLDITGLAQINAAFAQPVFNPPIVGSNFTLRLKSGNDIGAIIQALSRFGTVRALSSPRVTVLNNQSALLNVVENKVFFEFDVDITPAAVGVPGQTNIDSTIRSVPLGVMLNVLPTVDFKTGEITMMLRPTITSLAGEQNDPSITLALTAADPATIAQLNLDQLTNLIPELGVQEIDSVVKIQSGETIVIGGLMQDRTDVEITGVPVLSSLPYFGKLFGSHKDSVKKSELVIFLKATILPSSGVLDKADKELYKNFSLDRRPSNL